jgi:hypothetical protein
MVRTMSNKTVKNSEGIESNPEICVRLRKTTELLSQDSWCPGRDSNEALPEMNKSSTLTLH